MSEFDKEAEREKLREKYAAEEQKREATQRMSELLLRGATMTNQHCETCGDPLFRYEGQVFCPTCQTGQEAGTEETGTQPDGAETSRSQADGAQATDSQSEESAAVGEDAAAHPVSPESRDPTQPSRSPGADRGSTQPTRRSAPWPDRPPADADLPALRETDAGDAPAELEAVVARLARRAAATEDPTQAREWLAAAREASEALAALRSTGQR